MRTCTLCNALSPDEADTCVQCGADLNVHSARAVALAAYRANPRVMRIRVIVSDQACPVCRAMEGEYSPDEVPPLPTKGCSHADGCRCFYEPVLDAIYP